MSENHWTADNSEVYRQLASVAVPHRAEQVAALLTLIPFERESEFRVVEMASGEGFLSHAILEAFPHASLLALDGEESMRAVTSEWLRPFGSRATVDTFDMLRSDWYSNLDGVDCVVSSLCVHHLDDVEKQALFKEIYRRLSATGALLLADLVQPARAEVWELFGEIYERTAKAQAKARGLHAAYDYFVTQRWNYYRYPDPFDKPSTLFDQLIWLKQTGFAVVDCFWMQAGHAIYGGYKQAGIGDAFKGIPFDEALKIAGTILGEGERN